MLTTYNPQDYGLFVGIDTSKKSYAITHMRHDRSKKSLTAPASAKALYNYYQKHYPNERILYLYEAGPTGYGLRDYLMKQNADCAVVHPASIPKAPNDRVKNNKLDSQKLAEQALGGQIKGIRVPSDPYRELRHLATTRQSYAKDAKRAKQRIKGLLLFEDINLPTGVDTGKHWTARYCRSLRTTPSKNNSVHVRLHMLLDDLEYSKKRLLMIHRELRSFCNRHPSIKKNWTYLLSIPGFGFVVSTYFLARIGDPSNLGNVRELGSFAGLVPSERSTGEEQNKGPITHMGDKTLRSLLVEAAWAAIRKDRELRQFFCRIRSHHPPKKGGSIAIVAVARKLTMRAHRVLKDQRPYVNR